MYRRPKFLEALLEIRREMAREADYDVDLFTEIARSGVRSPEYKSRSSRRIDAAKTESAPLFCELTQPKDV